MHTTAYGYNDATQMADEKSGTSWWQTVPGVLTGLAAIITAVTGLIIALNRTNARNEAPATASLSREASSASAAASNPANGTRAATTGTAVPLPNPPQVTLDGGTSVITVLSARIEPVDADRRAFTVGIRHRQVGSGSVVFGSRFYRLIVGDEIREPTNLISEVVANDSTKDGEFRFEVPTGAKDVVLQITAYSGENKSRLPFKLP